MSVVQPPTSNDNGNEEVTIPIPNSNFLTVSNKNDTAIQRVRSASDLVHSRKAMKVSFSADNLATYTDHSDESTDDENSISTISSRGIKRSLLSSYSISSHISTDNNLTVEPVIIEQQFPPPGLTTGGEDRDVKFYKKLNFSAKRNSIFIFLTICGILGGTVAFAHDLATDWIMQYRYFFMNSYIPSIFARNPFVDITPIFEANPVLVTLIKLFSWCFYNCFLIYIVMVLTFFVSPAAEGSGLPPMRAILGGAKLVEPTSFATMVIKIIGLPMVLGAGMWVGKLGPTIHICGIIAIQLLKLSWFKKIRENRILYSQMIQCGCAVGIAANFGAPIGAVLYNVEVIGTFFGLGTYLKCFYASIIAAITSRLLHATVKLRLNFAPQWFVDVPSLSEGGFVIPELLAFCALGAISGVLGAVIINCNSKLMQWRETIGKRRFFFFKLDRWKNNKILSLSENRFVWTMFIALVTSICTFPFFIGNFMSMYVTPTLEDLFHKGELLKSNGAHEDWYNPNAPYTVIFYLAIFCILRLVVSVLSINLPIPAGVFVPFVAAGAGIGRLFGEVLNAAYPGTFGAVQALVPSSYAIVGAVSLVAAVTQGISAAVIVMEITGTGVHLPSLLASMISVRVSSFISLSIYDSIIKIRGWDTILDLKTNKYSKIKLKEIMRVVRPEFIMAMQEVVSPDAVQHILDHNTHLNVFPITDNEDKLTGVIKRKAVEDLLAAYKLQQTLETPKQDVSLLLDLSTRIESPYCTVTEDTIIYDAHVLFSMLEMEVLFVTRRNVLVGYLTRTDMKLLLQRFDPTLIGDAFIAVKKFFKNKKKKLLQKQQSLDSLSDK